MNSSRYQNNWFLKSLSSASLWEQSFIENILIFIDFVWQIIWCYCQKMNVSSFNAFGKDLLVKIKIIIVDVLIQRIQISFTIVVWKRIRESKIDLFIFILESVLENAFEFSILSCHKLSFSGNSLPLSIISTFINRFVTFPIFWLT